MANEFTVHRLNDQGLRDADKIATAFDTLLGQLKSIIPPGREYALVVTKLQEACFWAKRGIAVLPESQAAE